MLRLLSGCAAPRLPVLDKATAPCLRKDLPNSHFHNTWLFGALLPSVDHAHNVGRLSVIDCIRISDGRSVWRLGSHVIVKSQASLKQEMASRAARTQHGQRPNDVFEKLHVEGTI